MNIYKYLLIWHLKLHSFTFLTLECPRDWVEYKGTVSCYKFQRYPLLNVNDAKTRCAVSWLAQILLKYFNRIKLNYIFFLKSDGASLVSVESLQEHMFIQNYLSKNDIEQRRWYTSGQEIGNRWVWTSTGGVFGFEQGFLPSIATDQGTVLVYAYSCMYITFIPV